MSLVGQWRAIEGELPEGWGEARLSLAVADDRRRPRAAALLGPLTPGRCGDTFRFSAVRHRAGASSAAVVRALARLDDERIGGELSLVATRSRPAPVESAAAAGRRAGAWRAELETLPSDWSDAWVEVRFESTDHVEWAALLCAPLNPAAHARRVRLPLPRRAAVGLRHLARDGRPLLRAARRAGASRSPSRSSAPSPRRSTSTRRARSGTSTGRSCDHRRRPGLVPADRARVGGRRARTAGASERSTRCSPTSRSTSSTASPSIRA